MAAHEDGCMTPPEMPRKTGVRRSDLPHVRYFDRAATPIARRRKTRMKAIRRHRQFVANLLPSTPATDRAFAAIDRRRARRRARSRAAKAYRLASTSRASRAH
jgi:hypothetical protein